ncbi:beta-galactosidase trimerization domain-containing protein [Tepidibacillus marianensis]|uniref:beta-galactosidase trimerization domain-containing protein n=1 Tax=Tepidibacillus marianensis TaxID=3131995 RepID=UPI0030CDD1C1
MYDYENIWSWRFQVQSEGFDFTNELLRLYTPFYEWNAQIDVIPVDCDFSKYKVLVAPALQIIDEELSERFRKFVKDGGTILFSFRTGLKDKNNNIYLGKSLPGYVKDLAGITIHEIESLSVDRGVPVIETSTGKEYKMNVWRDLIEPETAEVLYKYGDDFYKERAAVTRNKCKEGMVYYIGGGIETNALKDIVKEIIDHHDIEYIKSEKDVEVYKRTSKGVTYLFVLNHSSEIRTFEGEKLLPFANIILRR